MQRIVIVLDTAPSMNARTADGRTRWDHALDEARNLIDVAGPLAEFRIAETSGNSAFGFTPDRFEARGLLEQLAPKSVEPRFPVLDGSETHVYFVSDGVALPDIPRTVETISVFEAAKNVGITAFDIRPTPSNPLEYEAYLEVHNFGEHTAIGVTLGGSSEQDRITRTVSVAPGQPYREVFDLSGFNGGAVQAAILAKDDALMSDDIATAYLPTKRRMRTLLVTTGNRLLQTLLKLDTSVDLVVTEPTGYQELPDIDAYVFDRFAPQTPPSKPALIIGNPEAPWLGHRQGTVYKPRITKWAEGHPIMQHVALRDISIQRAPRIDSENLIVIAASNDTPLIVASEEPRWVMLTFDFSSSDLALQPGFPVFIRNVLAWLDQSRPVIQRSNPLFFDVNGSVLEGERPIVPAGSWLRHELWFYMLLGAAALIGVEWFTYHRRITL